MPRQPYSVAVPSTGGRLHPSFLRREGLVRKVERPLAKGFLSPANGGNEGGVKTIERRDSYVNLGEIRARSKNSSKNLVVS